MTILLLRASENIHKYTKSTSRNRSLLPLVEIEYYGTDNIDILKCTQVIIIHCGTSNIGHNKQLYITGIMKIASAMFEKYNKMKIVITNLLPQDKCWSLYRRKLPAGMYCCRKNKKVHWVTNGSTLHDSLFYQDHLHLIELRNKKFPNLVTAILSKIRKGI